MGRETDLPGLTAWPLERQCPECGRVFCLSAVEVWGFRDREALVCSWGCLRKREARKEAEAAAQAARKRKRMLKPAQKAALIRELAGKGLTNAEICRETCFSLQLVGYYRKKIEEAGK